MGVKLQAGKQIAVTDQERDRSLWGGPGNRHQRVGEAQRRGEQKYSRYLDGRDQS